MTLFWHLVQNTIKTNRKANNPSKNQPILAYTDQGKLLRSLLHQSSYASLTKLHLISYFPAPHFLHGDNLIYSSSCITFIYADA